MFKKLKKLFLIVSSVLLFTVSCGAQPLEDADERIKQLNDSLLNEEPGFLNIAIGDIPEDSRPETFIVKRNFHRESRRILSFIDLLLAHSDQEECRRVLDQVCEIYFLQFHRFIGALAIDPTTNVQMFFPTQNFTIPGNIEGKYQNEQLIRLLKAKLQEILFNIYDCQNISQTTHIQYGYESLPLGLIMTKAIIQIFRTRSQGWGYDKKVDFVSQHLESAEKRFWMAIADSKEKNLVLSHVPSEVAISSFFNTMKTIMIPRPSHIPWGQFAKWALGAAAVAGGAYGIYWLVGKLSENVNNIREAANEAGTGLGIQVKDGVVLAAQEMHEASKDAGINLLRGGEKDKTGDVDVSVAGNKKKPNLSEVVADVLPHAQKTWMSGGPPGGPSRLCGALADGAAKNDGRVITEHKHHHDVKLDLWGLGEKTSAAGGFVSGAAKGAYGYVASGVGGTYNLVRDKVGYTNRDNEINSDGDDGYETPEEGDISDSDDGGAD
ncbi:hypothetical protein KAT92_00190 [Candidatus Babeliales bacterium]|nr:hypothetical protein [Candidatus Babeliales bacterium]